MSILKNALVTYTPDFLAQEVADRYFGVFNENFPFRYNSYKGSRLNRETCVFISPEQYGKPVPAIWGDEVAIEPFTAELIELKEAVERSTGWRYNVALCNRYTAFHSDNEEFGSTRSIASISLGIPRTFTFKSKDHVTPEKVEILLENGSLIYMGENCQENYRHGMTRENIEEIVPEDVLEKYDRTRINVTFRTFDYEN